MKRGGSSVIQLPVVLLVQNVYLHNPMMIGDDDLMMDDRYRKEQHIHPVAAAPLSRTRWTKKRVRTESLLSRAAASPCWLLFFGTVEYSSGTHQHHHGQKFLSSRARAAFCRHRRPSVRDRKTERRRRPCNSFSNNNKQDPRPEKSYVLAARLDDTIHNKYM